jgi:hypothetical protein
VGFSPTTEENCELSDKNTYDLDIDNPAHYEQSERFDHYQREARAAAVTDNCIDGKSTTVLALNKFCEFYVYSICDDHCFSVFNLLPIPS